MTHTQQLTESDVSAFFSDEAVHKQPVQCSCPARAGVIFLPLDEAVASTVLFVITSGSEGRADWRKRF